MRPAILDRLPHIPRIESEYPVYFGPGQTPQPLSELLRRITAQFPGRFPILREHLLAFSRAFLFCFIVSPDSNNCWTNCCLTRRSGFSLSTCDLIWCVDNACIYSHCQREKPRTPDESRDEKADDKPRNTNIRDTRRQGCTRQSLEILSSTD